MTLLNMTNGYMPLKPSSDVDPDIYRGAKLRQTQLEMEYGHGVSTLPNM
jgi:hypothetical protein